MPVALTRAVPNSLASCELTHLERSPIDVKRAAAEHEQYENELRRLGCRLERLAAAHDLPDSVFVEDTAVVLDEVAIIARSGASSRQPETASVAAALKKHRPLVHIEDPGVLDGGDVLRLGRTLYVGVSTRTSREGAQQLADAIAPFGYTVRVVRVGECLHLKSSVTALDDRTVLCNPEWIDVTLFDGYEAVAVHPAEPMAANVLAVGGAVVCAAGYQRTIGVLRDRGYDVRPVPVSELAKAEAGVTCCSLIVM